MIACAGVDIAGWLIAGVVLALAFVALYLCMSLQPFDGKEAGQ